jgi:pimeloyl-ACP methyl ester carboxylesterase
MQARTFSAAALLLAGLAVAATAATPAPRAAGDEVYDAEATTFEYPYPVHFYEFESQGQKLRMAYLDVSPARAQANGKVALLLHGKNFNASDWATTIASLTRAGFRAIAVDQIGFGKSSKPSAYQFSFAQLAANTRALLASIGVKRSIVVGHSMGGMLAARFAVAYPEATEKLVLVNPIGLEDYASLIPPRTVDDWYRQELKATPESVREYQRQSYYAGAWKPEYEAHTRLLAGWTRSPDWPKVAWDSALTYDMILTQPLVPELSRIRVPTLLIIGTRDRTALGRPLATPEVQRTMGDYARLGRLTQERIPGARLAEIPGVGHVPQVEEFPDFEKALLGFLR